MLIVCITAAFKLFSPSKENTYQPFISDPCQDASYFLDIRIDTLVSEVITMKKKTSLKTLLTEHKIKGKELQAVVKVARPVINLNQAAPGTTCHLLLAADGKLRYLVVERNPLEYAVIDAHTQSPKAYQVKKKAVYAEREVAGVINGDLNSTFKDLDIPRELLNQLGNIYAYSFDFYKLRNGDTLRLVYEEMWVDGVMKKATNIKSCVITNKGQRYYAVAYSYPGSNGMEYLDDEGNLLKRTFLEMPLKYGRLSSKFSKNRKHPVLHINKAHLGTDYAAPHGTPILATADGVVIEAASSRFNGNYVKVKHDKTYTTQYLHMSRFAKGVRKGTKVKQGDVIGYVGSTGLATGPHVCYRFWKNNVQVDPYRENLKFAKPIPAASKGAYMAHFKKLNDRMNALQPLNKRSLMKDAAASAAK